MGSNVVAEAQKPTQKEYRKNPNPKRVARGFEIPLFTRSKARNLYLSQGLPYKLIAQDTGLTVEQLQRLASREGWTVMRKETKKRLELESITRTQAMESAILDEAVSLSGQHLLKGLQRTGEVLETGGVNGARDFQSLTSGVKNLVGIIQAIRVPAETTQNNAGLVAFVIRVGDDAKQPEVNVTPAQPAIELQKL